VLRIAILVWVMLGAALAGTAVTALASGLAANPMKAIPLAALAGFVVAIPLSYIVAAKIGRARAG
jgi:amino acid permease